MADAARVRRIMDEMQKAVICAIVTMQATLKIGAHPKPVVMVNPKCGNMVGIAQQSPTRVNPMMGKFLPFAIEFIKSFAPGAQPDCTIPRS